MNSQSKHIELMDYARGVAILLVLLCHSVSSSFGYEFVPWDGWIRDFSAVPVSSLLAYPLSLGGVGVAVFFVISGFCIHLSFQQQGKQWGSGLLCGPSSFYILEFFW
jgi:peptidoglycan/LPS O-acetylase OafA/YrhL